MKKILIILLITVNLIACSKPTDVTSVSEDEEYKQRYTSVLCLQMYGPFLDIFSQRQRQGSTKEETINYLTQDRSLAPEVERFIKSAIDDAFAQPVYYPELKGNQYILENTRPDDHKKFEELQNKYTSEQKVKCLDALTPYAKANHQLLFGNM